MAIALATADYDLLLLDLGLPRKEGLDVARPASLARSVPVLITTARDAVTQRVAGLMPVPMTTWSSPTT